MPFQPRVDPRTETVVRMARDGLTTTDIAQRVGVNRTTVNNWLKAAGIHRKASPPQTRVTDEELLAMHSAGWSLATIGEEVGMSKSGVEARLVAARARAHPPARPPALGQLVRLRAGGASWSELALRSGRSTSTVRRQVLTEQARRVSQR